MTTVEEKPMENPVPTNTSDEPEAPLNASTVASTAAPASRPAGFQRGDWLIVLGLLAAELLNLLGNYLYFILGGFDIGNTLRFSAIYGRLGALLLAVALWAWQKGARVRRQDPWVGIAILAVIAGACEVLILRSGVPFSITSALVLGGAALLLGGAVMRISSVIPEVAGWLLAIGSLAGWALPEVVGLVNNIASPYIGTIRALGWFITSPALWFTIIALSYFSVGVPVEKRAPAAYAQAGLAALALLTGAAMLLANLYLSNLFFLLPIAGSLAALVGAVMVLRKGAPGDLN